MWPFSEDREHHITLHNSLEQDCPDTIPVYELSLYHYFIYNNRKAKLNKTPCRNVAQIKPNVCERNRARVWGTFNELKMFFPSDDFS